MAEAEITPPAGELDIPPVRPDLFVPIVPPLGSRDLVSDIPYTAGSEFGGVAGLIQPFPHVPTASERCMMIRAIDPEDDGTRPDSVTPPELDGLFDPR